MLSELRSFICVVCSCSQFPVMAAVESSCIRDTDISLVQPA